MNIGIFPLEMVVFPGEDINLHIFEPRYKLLIHHCVEEACAFGIIPFINNQMVRDGTLIEVVEVVKIYSDGKMDVRTTAKDKFTVDAFKMKEDTSTYHEAEVSLQQPNHNDEGDYRMELLSLADEWSRLLNLDLKLNKTNAGLSYLLGHKVGLNLVQEYALLRLSTETERQAFLIKHLEEIIPKVSAVEKSRQLIMMNGHFRDLKSPELGL